MFVGVFLFCSHSPFPSPDSLRLLSLEEGSGASRHTRKWPWYFLCEEQQQQLIASISERRRIVRQKRRGGNYPEDGGDDLLHRRSGREIVASGSCRPLGLGRGPRAQALPPFAIVYFGHRPHNFKPCCSSPGGGREKSGGLGWLRKATPSASRLGYLRRA